MLKRQTESKLYGTITEILRFRMGPRSILARKNLAFNRPFDVRGIINGQGLSPIRDLHYGVTNMAHSGCGIIAIYNALLLLDNPHCLQDVTAWGDLYASTALGLLGTRPQKAKRLFRRLGYTVTTVFNKTQFDSRAQDADVCLFSYWNRRGHPLEGMHTVCVRCEAGALEVYNQFDTFAGVSRRASFAKWLEDGIGPVVLYCICK